MGTIRRRNVMVSLSLHLLLLLLPAGAAWHADPAQARHQTSAPLPDTITVLLFAGFSIDRVWLSSPGGLLLDGSPIAGKTLAITRQEGQVRADRTTAPCCTVLARHGRALELSIGHRRRQVRGPVQIRATGKKLQMVAHVALRDYLAAALGAEASSSDPMEFLVALAVVQRNYMAAHRGRHAPTADLCDLTHCQLADLAGADSRIYEAVDRAMAISMTAGSALPCYYSANCGGSTLTPAQVWGKEEPGYANVPCIHCRRSPRHRWQRSLDASPAAEGVLRQAPAPPFINDDFKTRLGRAAGFNTVLSNTIDRIERRGRSYVIAGRGFGHRIGLCMEGANELARHGRSAQDILRFYFPTAHISSQR